MIKFIPFEVFSGEKNMKTDNELLEKAIQNKSETPVFRLYGWSPSCISLGKNQSEDFLDKQLLKSEGIDVVRRLTGGRALLHDNEITYSFICPAEYLEHGENVTKSYMEISQILIDTFKILGIELNFGGQKPVNTKFDYCMLISTGADLCYKGKKLIGSAQCRKNGYILQHGSILYGYNTDLLEKIFHEKVDTSAITCIKEINPKLTKEKILKSFVSVIKDY
jgi:lipoate-protein ligase A